MQDALFFFFGILALWVLLRFNSMKSIPFVALCLFLSLLAKETAILFIAMSLLYLFWWDRKRLLPFAGIMVLPVALWLVLKSQAVGLLGVNRNNAPIDNLTLWGRLLTAPSVVLFYIARIIFPWKLATAYYWVYPTFSINHTLLPLAIDLAVLAVYVYLAFVVRRRATKAQFYTYIFFGIWSALGILVHTQVIPLDMTVCETWFYFSTAGVLGVIGIVLVVFQDRIHPRWFYLITALIIVALGVRTAVRGLDWRNVNSLAYKDIAASKEDYIAETNIALGYLDQGKVNEARSYAAQSVKLYPNAVNNEILGRALMNLGDYPNAYKALINGLRYQAGYVSLYDDLADLTAIYGDPNSNQQLLLRAVNIFPQDANLWFYLAIFEYRKNDVPDAKVEISQAYRYGSGDEKISLIYYRIMNNLPLDTTFNPGH